MRRIALATAVIVAVSLAGTDIDSQAITLTVADTNRVPRQILPFIENATINEGQVFLDTIFGADPDGTTPTFAARLSGTDTLATNMSLTNLGNGSAEFRFSTPSGWLEEKCTVVKVHIYHLK